ncbi:hypothetical protein [Paenibacillus sp. 1P07SE]|uniref:hypothetical protein n=1 Tax=Paenibacillus sp. 1P07SE TaxID=3132209 RepID=UPI0039A5020D
MDTRVIGKMWAMLQNDPGEIPETAARFRGEVLKQAKLPFPYHAFLGLLAECTDQDKQRLAQRCGIRLRAKAGKAFPDQQFVQLLRPRLIQSAERLRVLQAILQSVLPLYGESEDESPVQHLETESQLVEAYGRWHYYWSLRFFPEKDEQLEQRLLALESEGKEEVNPTPGAGASSGPPAGVEAAPGSRDVRETREERLVLRERERRGQAERERDALGKQLRKLERDYSRLCQRMEALTEAQAAQRSRIETLGHERDQEAEQAARLDQDRRRLSRQLMEAQQEAEALRRSGAEWQSRHAALEQQMRRELERAAGAREDGQARETSQPGHRAEVQQAQEAQPARHTLEPGDGPAVVSAAVRLLNEQVDRLYSTLRSAPEPAVQAQVRTRLSDALQLINQLEAFFATAEELPPPSGLEPSAPPQDSPVQPTLPAEGELPQPAPGMAENGRAGTFYRRDHGGYIVLEHGESFNIPESMVNAVGLEHEAEVLCEPQVRDDGTMGQHLTILLQGDDTHAPIRQYMGYVELGEHFALYAVDMNDTANRFPIHEKDVEMQEPQDGDPCSFNVSLDGEVARLSRLYKRSEPLSAAETQARSRASERARTDKPARSPFLAGCRIAVVGGLSKWFESVVRETGAELVHETGENPERIHAPLRRCHALFLLLTSNSHNATWSCIEIAKAEEIPHFRIEGSKSNLRQQLWDNRELIRSIAAGEQKEPRS